VGAPAEKPAKGPSDKGGAKDAMSDTEIEQLTERVYRLMMQDVRLEHARGARGGT
jgi:hypothetical protein